MGPATPASAERIFQAFQHEGANDNHENWSCHNYAHNLMSSAEPNSIFMTEGGDNQVFSLLYFSYVERKRLDIDFFDQKGNVFPRLYGDLMNTLPSDLDIIRDLRDFQLFSTGRPVYMTWKRPNIHKLTVENFRNILSERENHWKQRGYPMTKNWKLNTVEQIEYHLDTMVPKATFNRVMKDGENISDYDMQDLGPWYLKQFGILWRVTHVKYAFIDALELFGKANFTTLQSEVRKSTRHLVSRQQFMQFVDELEEDGYLKKLNNENYEFVKSFNAGFEGDANEDFWNKYTMDYTNVPNANQWDYLTREIFSSYHTTRASQLEKRAGFYQSKAQQDYYSADKAALLEKSENEKAKALSEMKKATHYGSDMPNILFGYGQKLYRLGRLEEALPYFVKTGEQLKQYHTAHAMQAEIHKQVAKQATNSEQRNDSLDKALEAYDNAMESVAFALRINNRASEIEQNQDYRRYQALHNQTKSLKELDFENMQKKLEQARNENTVQAYNQVLEIYQRSGQDKEALNIIEEMKEKFPNDIQVRIIEYQFYKPRDPNQAFNKLNEILMNYGRFHNAGQIPQENFILEYVSYCSQLLNQSIQNKQYPQALQLSREGKRYAQMFISQNRNNERWKNEVSQMERASQEFDKVISALDR